MTVATPQLSVRQVLGLRLMRPYMVAFLLDTLGDLLWYVTLGWVAARASTPAAAGLILCAGAVPALLLAPFGGVLIGRIGAGRATLLTMTARTLAMLVWVIAIWRGSSPLVVLAVLAFVLGCIDGLHRPALDSWPFDIAGDTEGVMTSITAIERVGGRLAQAVAGLLGGFLLSRAGLNGPTLAAGAMFLLSLIVFAGLSRRVPAPALDPDAAAETLLAGARGGFSAVAAHPVLARTLPVHGLFNALTAGLTLAILPLKANAEHWDAAEYGWMYAAWGVGLLVGTLTLLGAVNKLHRKVALALVLVSTTGVLCILFGLTHSAPVAVVLIGAIGLLCGPIGPSLGGYLRESVKDRADRGPIVGVQSLALEGVEPFGFLAVGALAAVFGITGGCVAIGSLILAMGLWALAWPGVRSATS